MRKKSKAPIHMASLNPSIAGGLRIAYVAAPAFAREQLKQSIWASIVMVAPLTVELATMWIEDGTANRTAQRKRLEANARQEIAQEILRGQTYRSHAAAYNIWLDLPEGWTSAEFALELRRRGVAVTPASAFTVDKRSTPAAVRICLGAAESRDQLRTGLGVIAGMLRDGEHRSSGLV